jgi:hypothetical protein
MNSIKYQLVATVLGKRLYDILSLNERINNRYDSYRGHANYMYKVIKDDTYKHMYDTLPKYDKKK